MPVQSKDKYYFRLFFVLLAVLTLFRLWYIGAGILDLSPDEAHYWEWSRNLDISYYSKGPLIAYIIYFFTAIGGNTEFFARLGAVLMSAITGALLFLLVKNLLHSEKKGFYTFLLLSIIPLFNAGSVLMTIDPPFILCWMSVIFCMERLSATGKARYWYWMGIITGIGFLAKYTMLMIIPSIALFLILSKNHRFWARRKDPYLSLAISLIFFLPVLIWNSQHGWVSLKHVLEQGDIRKEYVFTLKYFFDFIGTQAAVVTPFVFAGMVYCVYKSFLFGIKEHRDEHIFLFSFAAPLFLLYFILSLHTRIQGNWIAPCYPVAAASLIHFLIDYNEKRGKHHIFSGIPGALTVISLVLGISSSILLYDTNLLLYAGIHLPAKKDPTARLKGWRELGERVSRILDEMDGDRPPFIFSKRYQISSELAFYVKGNPRVYCAYFDRRLNQYDFWEGLETRLGDDAIFVEGKDLEHLYPEIEGAFDSCTKELFIVMDSTRYPMYRKGARRYSIYECTNFKGIHKGKEKVIY